MKPIYLIIAIIIIIILAGGCVFLNMKMLQYKKVIDYYFPVSEGVSTINGKITEIKDNVLSIETKIQDSYTVPEKWKTKIYKTTVNDNTKITKFELETGKETMINFSTLKVGDEIFARADENIQDKAEFAATSIELYIVPTK